MRGTHRATRLSHSHLVAVDAVVVERRSERDVDEGLAGRVVDHSGVDYGLVGSWSGTIVLTDCDTYSRELVFTRADEVDARRSGVLQTSVNSE